MEKIVAVGYKCTPGHLVHGRVARHDARRDGVGVRASGCLDLNHTARVFLLQCQAIIVRGIVSEAQKFGHFERGESAEQKPHTERENHFRMHRPNPHCPCMLHLIRQPIQRPPVFVLVRRLLRADAIPMPRHCAGTFASRISILSPIRVNLQRSRSFHAGVLSWAWVDGFARIFITFCSDMRGRCNLLPWGRP